MRRVLVPLAVVALAASSVTASAAVRPKKPAIPACPSFTDAAGDEANGDVPVAPADPALDIVGTKLTVANNTLTAILTMGAAGQPDSAEGAEYSAGFTLGGKEVRLFGTASQTKPVMEQAFAMTGITVDGDYVSGTSKQVTITTDAATKTVKLTASLGDIGAAAGSKAVGTVKGLASAVRGTYVLLLEPYDSSESTKTLALGGCKP